MTHPAIHHTDEPQSNAWRDQASAFLPRSLRTFTPSQAVIARSAGVYHWTADGRRLFDFTSGVLVANLGHNPVAWMRRFCDYMSWPADWTDPNLSGCVSAVGMTTYNAITPLEVDASRRLVQTLRDRPGGSRMEQVLWAASGSEAIQKALWSAMAFNKTRNLILATRHGFHGKKGLAHAVTGCEADPERDPRVRFISFPMQECRDVSLRDHAFNETPYVNELEALFKEHGEKIGTLITEPYLGGGGSYHPPHQYLQLLQRFCREHDIVFILDEVQANFGRTGKLFAYETYGIEPDIVVLGKGLGNGIPVAACVGRRAIFSSLEYGDASDTWSANPLNAASVLATLDEFAANDVLTAASVTSKTLEDGLIRLKRYPFVAHVRGENGGMVWGVEMQDHAGRTAPEWANAFVLAAYRGGSSSETNAVADGVHLLGPLAKRVVRIAPPLIMTVEETESAIAILDNVAEILAES